ncbi:MAG: MarR family transcriptional regulator [Rhizobiales bacterium]|nr:MarR family transcriptional regulator [Hyphomicrobiales bacterium]
MSGRALAQKAGVTPTQLIILQLISKFTERTPSEIAKEAGITQPTVTSIIDKLERRHLIVRRKGIVDRRRVYINISEQGHEVLARGPDLLQERFISRFKELADWEQSSLIAALERIAAMLDATHLDVAPILDVGAIDQPFYEG